MTNELMQHQREAITALLNNRRFLLADEPGLGKTRVLLEAAKERVGNRKMLVLCPTSIVRNWENEVAKWGFRADKIVIVGYEYQFLKMKKELLAGRWGVIVADEAHFLRRWEAQRTMQFKELLKGRDSCVWLCTGTPVVRGAQDMHTLLSFLQPGEWGKYGDFCEKYCKHRQNQWKPGGREYYGVKNGAELGAAVKSLMIRRYKKDVVNLPDKIVSRIPIELPNNGTFDVFTNEGIIQEVLRAVEHGGMITMSEHVIETLQDLGIAKAAHVHKFCSDTFGNLPLVVFAHHRSVIHELVEKFGDEGRDVSCIHGGMSKDEKAIRVQDFQDGKLDVLVCGINVAGVGINLFRASYCVFAELPWTQAALDQAADRLHRIGQQNCVGVYYTYCRGTFEDRMLKLIEERKFTMKEIVGHAE